MRCSKIRFYFFLFFFFFFNDTATTEIYTLSLHDALPIFGKLRRSARRQHLAQLAFSQGIGRAVEREPLKAKSFGENTDRKSTRLNSSHGYISYAVFCLKKKKKVQYQSHIQLATSTNLMT